MRDPRLICWSGCLVFCLLAGRRVEAQPLPLYYSTSSSTVSQNTLDSVATNGSGSTTLFTAKGEVNQIFHCTAVAVDGFNGLLFLLDGTDDSIWSLNLYGGSLTLVKSGLTNFPTDLALDVMNKKIYYTTSSTVQSSNTVQVMGYSGNNNAILFTASGSSGNGVSRCTAIAVDPGNSKIFVADAGARKVWSMSLTGTGLTSLATTTNAFPTSLALDVTNQQVYFTASSTAQSSNLIQRVNYNGSGLLTWFTASGSVQRCTALDYDPARSTVYLSDAGANTIWRIPSRGSTATVLSGLPAVVKKLRWYSLASPPPPELVSISIEGTSVSLLLTNEFTGRTYNVLTATNLTQPLTQWQPVFTNIQETAGNTSFLVTNAFNTSSRGQRYYTLQVQ